MSEASQGAQPPPTPPSGSLWRRRLWLVLKLIVFVWTGMILVVVPWGTDLMRYNSLLASHLKLLEIFNHGFVKGALTGLGLVNIWIGVWDAVHYHE